MEASVYSRKAWLKSGKAVMGLVVSSVLRRSKAVWQSGLQWKTASFLVRGAKDLQWLRSSLYIAGNNRRDQGRSGLQWQSWEAESPI